MLVVRIASGHFILHHSGGGGGGSSVGCRRRRSSGHGARGKEPRVRFPQWAIFSEGERGWVDWPEPAPRGSGQSTHPLSPSEKIAHCGNRTRGSLPLAPWPEERQPSYRCTPVMAGRPFILVPLMGTRKGYSLFNIRTHYTILLCGANRTRNELPN